MDTKWPNFIILGAMRCGTTSVFRYLSEHPAVCTGHKKELNYFLLYDDIEEITEKYAETFLLCSYSTIAIEASPAYLEQPEKIFPKIKKTIPEIRTAIFLREPVGRVVSIYKSIWRAGVLLPDVTFDNFIDAMIRDKPDINIFKGKDEEFCYGIWREIYHVGRYSSFLATAMEIFGTNLYIGFLENLSHAPYEEMSRICNFLGIDAKFYYNYSFSIENPSVIPRWPWLYQQALRINAKLEPILSHHIRRIIRTIHHALNTNREQNVVISSRALNKLMAFYRVDSENLFLILQKANIPSEIIPEWVTGGK